MNISVSIVDGNNITCQVTPLANQVITIDRGVSGVGIASIVPVTISTLQYLRITYTNGVVQDVGPLTSTAYFGETPISITGNTISLLTVPITLGGTGQTTANAGLNALLPSQSTNSGKYLKTDGTNAAWDLLDISTADITGVLKIANGGTNGSATPTAGAIAYGTGTAYDFTSAGTSGQVLTSGGAGAPTWTTLTTGTVTSVSGTTGRITSTGGSTPIIDLASGVATAGTTGSTSIIPVITIDTYGRVTSITTAANPQGTVTSVGQSFTGGLISVAGSPITSSGTLALTVAGTSGGIPYFSSGTTWASSAALAANTVVVGGGAGVAPSTKANLTYDGTTFTSGAPTVISMSSSSDALRITQTGAGNALLVEDSTNPDSTPFVIDASGKVIVGNTTTLPSPVGYPLQVVGSGSMGMTLSRFDANVTAPIAAFAKSRNATAGVFGTIVNSGDALGDLRFYGDDGVTAIEAARISAAVDGTPGTNDMPGRLVFSTTADGGTVPTEAMRIGSAQTVSIGSGTVTGVVLNINKTITGASTSYGTRINAQVQSDVVNGRYFASSATTQATSFTATSISHFYAEQSTFGAGSTVSNQYGFVASSGLTGATNNFGFFGQIPSATGSWNLYLSGTANNHMAGTLGLGTVSGLDATQALRIGKQLTGGVNAYGINSLSSSASDVTGSHVGFNAATGTATGAYTLTNLYNFASGQGTIGAGSIVTNQFGFSSSVNLINATTNYGYYGNIAAPTSGITTTGTISTISSSTTTVTVAHQLPTPMARQ